MTTPTAARTYSEKSAHWYYANGLPAYEIPKKTGGGMRSPTLADARKLGLLFSVSRVIDQLAKPGLQSWLTEQAVLACLTTPRLDGEGDDAFVHRVLQEEKQQEQESRAARDLGSQMHDALESLFNGLPAEDDIAPWVLPAFDALQKYGAVQSTEAVVIGPGYGGKADLITETTTERWIWDFKTTKKFPDKEPWPEHRLQLSAYANALWLKNSAKPVRVGNCYISTVEQGKYAIFEHDPNWRNTYLHGFAPLIEYLCWATGYCPPGSELREPEPVSPPEESSPAEPPQESPEPSPQEKQLQKPWQPEPGKHYARTEAVRVNPPGGLAQ